MTLSNIARRPLKTGRTIKETLDEMTSQPTRRRATKPPKRSYLSGSLNMIETTEKEKRPRECRESTTQSAGEAHTK